VFGKKETQEKRKLFWTSFGVYMKKYSLEYGRVKWVNYTSGCKGVYFKCDADNKIASFSIEIQGVSEDVQEIYFMQFEEYKKIIEDTFPFSLTWVENAYDTFGKPMKRIYCEHLGSSIYLEENWKELFEFFEANLVALHEFWDMVGDQFRNLHETM
jgi:hypothetical protein